MKLLQYEGEKMARKKSRNLDSEMMDKLKENVKEHQESVLEEMEKQLKTILPSQEQSKQIDSLMKGYKTIFDEEMNDYIEECIADGNPIIPTRSLVMEIYEIEEGTRAYESIESQERDLRRINELLKHDVIVKMMLDRGIREREKDAYVSFVKKIINNPQYKKYLSMAKKEREDEHIQIPYEMLIDILNLLENMAENTKERNLVNMRRTHIAHLEEIKNEYKQILNNLAKFDNWNFADKIHVTKSYLASLKELSLTVTKELEDIEKRATESKKQMIEMTECLYPE